MPTTWDPANKNAAIGLSGGNLTATSSAGSGSANAGVIATTSLTGKKYFEVTASTATPHQYYSVGVMNGSASLSNNIGATNGIAYVNNFGGVGSSSLYLNGVSYRGGMPALATGQVVRVAIDRTANKLWWAINTNTWNGTDIWMGDGSGGNDPATGAGGANISTVTGTILPAFSSAWTGDVAVLNAGATSFAYAVPAGFVGIDSAPVTTQARVMVLA